MKKRVLSVFKELLILILKIVAMAVVFVLAFTFMFGIIRYPDASMYPSVKEGDLVIYYRLEKKFVASELAVVEYNGVKQVRRVIATAGDTVDVKDGSLFINGSRQAEHGIYESTYRYQTAVEFPLTLKEGEVFLLGDAREDAEDSRVYGAVEVEETLGKVMTMVRRRQF